jgi:hypothetical protein
MDSEYRSTSWVFRTSCLQFFLLLLLCIVLSSDCKYTLFFLLDFGGAGFVYFSFFSSVASCMLFCDRCFGDDEKCANGVGENAVEWF